MAEIDSKLADGIWMPAMWLVWYVNWLIVGVQQKGEWGECMIY